MCLRSSRTLIPNWSVYAKHLIWICPAWWTSSRFWLRRLLALIVCRCLRMAMRKCWSGIWSLIFRVLMDDLTIRTDRIRIARWPRFRPIFSVCFCLRLTACCCRTTIWLVTLRVLLDYFTIWTCSIRPACWRRFWTILGIFRCSTASSLHQVCPDLLRDWENFSKKNEKCVLSLRFHQAKSKIMFERFLSLANRFRVRCRAKSL